MTTMSSRTLVLFASFLLFLTSRGSAFLPSKSQIITTRSTCSTIGWSKPFEQKHHSLFPTRTRKHPRADDATKKHGLTSTTTATKAAATTTTTLSMSAAFGGIGDLGDLPPQVLIWILSTLVLANLPTPLVIKATKTWYPKINLPEWTPPNIVFAPVWTILYSCMGCAAYIVYYMYESYRSASAAWKSKEMILALIHFAFNLSWAPTFFGLQKLRAAHAINLAILGTLLPLIWMFYQVVPVAGILLVPYLAWMLYATKLGQEICKLNPTDTNQKSSSTGYNNARMQAQISQLQAEAAIRAGLTTPRSKWRKRTHLFRVSLFMWSRILFRRDLMDLKTLDELKREEHREIMKMMASRKKNH